MMQRYQGPPPDPFERVRLLVWSEPQSRWADAGVFTRYYAEALQHSYSIKWPPRSRFRIVQALEFVGDEN